LNAFLIKEFFIICQELIELNKQPWIALAMLFFALRLYTVFINAWKKI